MDQIEVERKRVLPDTDRLRAQLLASGYRASDAIVEIDTYYSRPDVDYLTTVECLRVREVGDRAEITYKPASNNATHDAGDVISKRETNVQLIHSSQAGAAHQLLTAIGMVPLVTVNKARLTYTHPDDPHTSVVIDDVEHAGTFVETEILSRDPHADAARLEQIESALGIADHPIVQLPYRDLVLAAQDR